MGESAGRTRSAGRTVASGVAAVYLVALTLIAFWPTPVDRGARGSIAGTLAWLHAHGVPVWVDYALVEFSANIALFVPVGLLTVLLVGRRHWWLGIVVGVVASCLIELGQYAFLPGRFATLLDVLANSVGAYVGALGALVFLTVLRRRPDIAPGPTAR